MKPIIKAENISVIYQPGESNETYALRDVSFEIYPQEYVIIFGPSGSGKSTLMYTIAGIETPTKGRLIAGGSNILDLNAAEKINYHLRTIGMVFQAYHLIESLTVLENVTLPQVLASEDVKVRKEKAEELLGRFDILKQGSKMPDSLSGGQQQRVAIARALVNDPEIILADEPIGNLDSKSGEQVMKLFDGLNKRDKKTIIMVTHDARYLSYADRIIHIKDGQATQEIRNQNRIQVPKMLPAPHHEEGKHKEALSDLAKVYPSLEAPRLYAKLLVSLLLLPYDPIRLDRIESLTEQFIKNKITLAEFKDKLDNNLGEGGAGLYKDKAEEFAMEAMGILRESELLKRSIETGEGIGRRVFELKMYLLGDYSGKLKPDQSERLEDVLRKRLELEYDGAKLKKFLDMPFAEGGVGLRSETAREFAEKVEVLLK